MKKYQIQEERAGYRLINESPHVLSDAQLLSVLAGDTPNCVEKMRNALASAQGLRPLMDTLINRKRDLGKRTIEKLLASLELGRRYLEAEVRARPVLSNPDKTKTYAKAWLCRYPHEVFACMFIDNRHRIIDSEIMFTGTIDGASVYPREVVKRCMELNAAAVIFAHNHPSGVAEPSQADRQITLKLTQALALLDVRVLDHLVVGDKLVTSMAERGLM